MTIRFAAAKGPGQTFALSPLTGATASVLAERAARRVANDNAAKVDMRANDQLLRAALRHFAEHGLGAARAARHEAEQAFFAGDRKSYQWWLDITHTLDRRLAVEAERRMLPELGK